MTWVSNLLLTRSRFLNFKPSKETPNLWRKISRKIKLFKCTRGGVRAARKVLGRKSNHRITRRYIIRRIGGKTRVVVKRSKGSRRYTRKYKRTGGFKSVRRYKLVTVRKVVKGKVVRRVVKRLIKRYRLVKTISKRGRGVAKYRLARKTGKGVKKSAKKVAKRAAKKAAKKAKKAAK